MQKIDNQTGDQTSGISLASGRYFAYKRSNQTNCSSTCTVPIMTLPEAFKSTPLGVVVRSLSKKEAWLYNDEKHVIKNMSRCSTQSTNEKGQQVVHVDWYVKDPCHQQSTNGRDGPDDVENPKNWTSASKTMVRDPLVAVGEQYFIV